jgi:hypothetical protein
MSQQDVLHSRQYVTPGMWYRNTYQGCASESGLREMDKKRNDIAMRVSKCAGRRKKNG